jgi:hypothetical protein
MKSIIILVVIFLLLGFLFFIFDKTYTQGAICGWDKETEEENWPCLCLGERSTSSDDSAGILNTYYCTGLNLSCSQFMLENYHCSGSKACPVSCQLTID